MKAVEFNIRDEEGIVVPLSAAVQAVYAGTLSADSVEVQTRLIDREASTGSQISPSTTISALSEACADTGVPNDEGMYR